MLNAVNSVHIRSPKLSSSMAEEKDGESQRPTLTQKIKEAEKKNYE